MCYQEILAKETNCWVILDSVALFFPAAHFFETFTIMSLINTRNICFVCIILKV